MNSQHLTKRQIDILESLRDRANVRIKELLERAIKGNLSENNIEAVCEAINDEYLMKGIKENYNPNEYGKELESLLDQINRPRLLSVDLHNERMAGE